MLSVPVIRLQRRAEHRDLAMVHGSVSKQLMAFSLYCGVNVVTSQGTCLVTHC